MRKYSTGGSRINSAGSPTRAAGLTSSDTVLSLIERADTGAPKSNCGSSTAHPRHKAATRTRYRRRRYRHRRASRRAPPPGRPGPRRRPAGFRLGSPCGRECRRPERLGSPPPTSVSGPAIRPSASGPLWASTRVWKVKSAPSRTSARAVVNSLALDAGTKATVGVQLVKRAAAFQVHYLDSPEGGTRGGGGVQQPRDLLGQRSGVERRGQQGEDGQTGRASVPRRAGRLPLPYGHGSADARALHLPVTFDSSQINRINNMTMHVPSRGMPITTPTPQAAAAYPRLAGASRPPISAREKMPLKKPG